MTCLKPVFRLSLLLGAVLAVPLVTAAPVDAGASQVSATFRQLGVPVTGPFRRLQGDIDFDAAKPLAARGTLEIDVDSFDIGDKDYNAEVAKKDWFDARKHPKATFVLRQVTGSGNTLKAEGVLTIKGKSQAVQFPVTVKTLAGRTQFEGRVPVSRLAFNIGEGEWKDTSLVADEVVIEFRLLTAAPSGKAPASGNPAR